MLRVVEPMPDGRTLVFEARALPADAVGPMRFAAGRLTGPAPAAALASELPHGDELCALAAAVGVMS
jgi:hypothetical protein